MFARSYLFQRLQWSSTEAHRELCYLKGRSDDECQNYVRVFGRQGPDRFLVCGTNAYKPLCRQFTIKDGAYVKQSDMDGLGLCPYDPRHNSTAVFAEGQLYAATVADFSGGEPLIHRDKIRTERSDLNQLNGPNFVSTFAYQDYVFFFYRETAVEYMNCGKSVYSRVGRVCQHDKGGPHAFSDRWTSFLKARLNCSVPGEYPFYFNEIQSTSDVTDGRYAGKSARLVYGVFTTPVNSIGGSAICAFSMDNILEVFQGAFKKQETINSNWLRVLSEKVPEPRPGACVNDSRTLPDITVNFVKAHPLMDDAVQSYFSLPVITKTSFNYRFTKVAVDSQVKALDGKAYDILYIGTDDGRVLKALNTRAPESYDNVGQVIVSDVQVLKFGQAVKDLLVVHLAGEASKLVVFADSEIRAVPLHHCDSSAAATCRSCVALQDPHCAWDATANLCVAVLTKLHDNDADKTLFQDIPTGRHRSCGHEPEVTKSVQPAVAREIGREESDGENEIIIELDRENQYGRTQPRANEPQGVTVTPVVYSAQTLTGALIGTCFCSLVAGFAFGFWFSQRLRGSSYPEPSEQRQQLNRLTESSESPGFNNKSINLVLNVPPKNPNGKNANSSAENKPVQKDPTGSGASSTSSSSDLAESDERNDEDGDDDEDDDGTTPTSLTTGIATDHTNNTHKPDEDHYEDHYESIGNDEVCTLEYFDGYNTQQRSTAAQRCSQYHQSESECAETTLMNAPTCEESGGSDSANSLDDLCRRHSTIENDLFDRHSVTNNARDHYMVPTRSPREFNEKILSLFNPQFLPNFNNMVTYIAAHSPPPRSQSMAQYSREDDNFLLRGRNYRKRDDTNSVCFRRGLTHEAPRE
ncbi:Semaphorin-1A [Trachymyrmex zeteki]|uniref:Semaphorin-1A n=1 Tax=Mycetomoellerius zeteki TaxID=64791 RepID=A0A151WG11_9HYME|nr:Semaphorin-1A [Trachymyrmex zeteki]